MKLLHGIVKEVDGCVAGPPTSVSSCIVVTPLLSKSCNDNRQSIISQNSLFKSWPSGKQGGVDPSIIDIIVPRSRYIDELSRNRNPINDTLGRRERWIVLSLSCFVTTWSPAKKQEHVFYRHRDEAKNSNHFRTGKIDEQLYHFGRRRFAFVEEWLLFKKRKKWRRWWWYDVSLAFVCPLFPPFVPFSSDMRRAIGNQLGRYWHYTPHHEQNHTPNALRQSHFDETLQRRSWNRTQHPVRIRHFKLKMAADSYSAPDAYRPAILPSFLLAPAPTVVTFQRRAHQTRVTRLSFLQRSLRPIRELI